MARRQREEVHREFCLRDLIARHQLEDLGVYGRIILKWIFKKWNGEARIGFFQLDMGTDGGCL